MKLPKNPTAFDVARKVICDAFDLVASGDETTLATLIEAADHVVGCGFRRAHPSEWRSPPKQRRVKVCAKTYFVSGMDKHLLRWWQRYLAADDVRDCLVEADIKRNKAECRRRAKKARRKP